METFSPDENPEMDGGTPHHVIQWVLLNSASKYAEGPNWGRASYNVKTFNMGPA